MTGYTTTDFHNNVGSKHQNLSLIDFNLNFNVRFSYSRKRKKKPVQMKTDHINKGSQGTHFAIVS